MGSREYNVIIIIVVVIIIIVVIVIVDIVATTLAFVVISSSQCFSACSLGESVKRSLRALPLLSRATTTARHRQR